MKYYALFFDGKEYIEKCLILIRHICSPNSSSLPHITIRVFKESEERAKETENRKVSSLNLIEAGTFNFEKKNSADVEFVVYVRCESEELEGAEYKPDFPNSKLHLTLYEGKDYEFAKRVYEIVSSCRWHFSLEYASPKSLVEMEIGSKKKTRPDFARFFYDVFGDKETYDEKLIVSDMEYKLHLIKSIVNNINRLIISNHLKMVDSIYSSGQKIENARRIGDIPSTIIEESNKAQKKNYITPPEYALDMAESGLEALTKFGGNGFNNSIRFGDASVGTGMLFMALKYAVDRYNTDNSVNPISISDAFGVDIDRNMAKTANERCHGRGLKVFCGDALNTEIPIKNKCNLMLVNPPFNRHVDIPEEYKKQIRERAKKITEIEVSNQSGLYVYFVLIMHDWLAENGIGVWLLPSTFMQTKYGKALKEYLIYKVDLLRVHIYDEEYEQFPGVSVTNSIVVFQKKRASLNKVVFSFGKSISSPEIILRKSKKDIEIADNWRNYIFSDKMESVHESMNPEEMYNLEEYFTIRRGLATGANRYFVMPLETARQKNIPLNALKPVLPKAKFLESRIIERDAGTGYPILKDQLVLIDSDMDEKSIKEKHLDFYNYLQEIKNLSDSNGKKIIDRTLIKNRNPWYKQERRDPPLFLLTYMGRKKSEDNNNALYFLLNRSDAIALNTYLLLYPNNELKEALRDNPKGEEYVLNKLQGVADNISFMARTYSGGLKKIEPKELSKVKIEKLDLGLIKSLKKQ